MKEKGHLASKRNFARRNETALGPRGQAEDTNKIEKIKIKRLWLRLWGPPKIHWPLPGFTGPNPTYRLNSSLIGTRKARIFITSVIYWNNMCACVHVGSCNFRFYIIVVILVLSRNDDLVIIGELRIYECLFFSYRSIGKCNFISGIKWPSTHTKSLPRKKPRIIMIWWWNVLYLKQLCRNHTVLIQW